MVQLDLFGLVADGLTATERHQTDWTAWLHDPAGRWRCPACGQVEPTGHDLYLRHGFQPDLAAIGHPYHYDWPQAGRCKATRIAWLKDHDPTYTDPTPREIQA